MIGWLVGWLRDLGSLRETRDRAVKAEQRLQFYEGQMGKLRRENRELREANTRLLQAESLLETLLEIDQLPEVGKP